MDIQDYLIDQTGLDWQALLAERHWLLPPQFNVWLLTRSGDLFIIIPDDSIHMLDVGAGTLKSVAKSRDEFCNRVNDPEIANDWLMIPIIDQLAGSDILLAVGQCYSFRTLPTLGGSYTADKRMPFGIREHFGGWGSVQRQISNLPDGTQIVVKPVS